MMRVLIVSDVFPPRCDGSGWSTFALCHALAAAGCELRVVRPEPGLAGVRRREVGGIEVTDVGFPYRDVPYLRNFLKNDLLYPRLTRWIEAELASRPVDVVHAQHVLSAPPAVAAARHAGVPVVVTVRDYWPICYFTTWQVGGERCPDCRLPKMLACMREKDPRWYWAGLPLVPYMRANVRRKQRALQQADAVIAVSRYVADEALHPFLDAARIHVIPNLIDVAAVIERSATPPAVELPERFVVFVGKFQPLKGAHLALDVAARLEGAVPMVLVGDGPDRSVLEARIRRERLNARLLPWLDNEEVWRVMRRAEAVLVPSLWAEPLSRAVLEAMAVGTPVVATDLGGVRDQIAHHESGLLAPANAGALADAVRTLLVDPELRRRLAEAARRSLLERFDESVVGARVRSLYRQLAAKGVAANGPEA